jgi:hypothetical protein
MPFWVALLQETRPNLGQIHHNAGIEGLFGVGVTGGEIEGVKLGCGLG